MALVTVYLPDGTEANVESVDAREYVQHCGYSYTKPAGADEVVEQAEEVKVAKVAKAAKAVPAAPWTPQ